MELGPCTEYLLWGWAIYSGQHKGPTQETCTMASLVFWVLALPWLSERHEDTIISVLAPNLA
jgi:hypothetical protein